MKNASRSIELHVDMDSITINGTKVPRPSRIARSVWVQVWEIIKYELWTGFIS